nr:hypothetical protein [Deltaproteobacteria bacterium]
MKRPRNRTKARMWRETRNGEEVVIKSYGSHPLLFRLYGWFTLANETRAYGRLAGVPGIVHCYGFRDKHTLELEYVSGNMLSSLKPGSVSAAVFEKLDQIVGALHQRGVANGDLHRSNVLITKGEDVYLVDFAHSLVARDPQYPGKCVRIMMKLDRHALERLRAHYLNLPKPVPVGAFGVLYRTLSSLKGMRLRWRRKNRGQDVYDGIRKQ